MIGIVAAHPIELRPLVARLRAPRHGRGVTYGRLGETPVALAALGQGWRRAEASASRFFEAVPCRVVVVTGFAGATQPGCRVGDLVIPETVMDLRRPDGRGDGVPYRVPMAVQLFQARTGARGGVMASVARVVAEPAEKARLGRDRGVTAVDLESAAVVAVAAQRGVPWLVARVVLDPVDQPLGVRSPAHAVWLGCSVAGWGRLWQFGRDVAAACQQLGDRVSRVVEMMNRDDRKDP